MPIKMLNETKNRISRIQILLIVIDGVINKKAINSTIIMNAAHQIVSG
jgi:hypothetical protein